MTLQLIFPPLDVPPTVQPPVTGSMCHRVVTQHLRCPPHKHSLPSLPPPPFFQPFFFSKPPHAQKVHPFLLEVAELYNIAVNRRFTNVSLLSGSMHRNVCKLSLPAHLPCSLTIQNRYAPGYKGSLVPTVLGM